MSENYWDERYREQGHTGWSDKVVYDYDQPLRLKAIRKSLYCAKISIGSTTRILDVGCGTGDLIHVFATQGALISGIDVSSRVLEQAERSLSRYPNVELRVGRIEDLDVAPASYDLVTSITVLQHIIEPAAFSNAIKNICRIIKPGGSILILESLPVGTKSHKPYAYLHVRTRGEVISAFESEELTLRYEMGIPQLGINLLHRVDRCAYSLARLVRRSSRNNEIQRGHQSLGASKSKIGKLYAIFRRLILTVTKPLDKMLVPFPRNLTRVRILVFTKSSHAL